MGHSYRISAEQFFTLQNWYIRFGCTSQQAALLSKRAFDHLVEKDDSLPESPEWEINYHVLHTRTSKVQPRNGSYGNWMKGGWNRLGTWENKKVAMEKKLMPKLRINPVCGWPDLDGMSFDYISYMKKCGRQYCSENYFLQDAVRGLYLESETFTKLGQLPYRLAATVSGDKIYITLMGNAEDRGAKHHVFAVDVSGSMSCRWILVQLSMTAMFMSMPEGSDVTILAYSDVCQIGGTVHAGDMESFIISLESIKAIGGFGEAPILQVAYGILNRYEEGGMVTLFTDEFPKSAFPNQTTCEEFVSEQADAGYLLNLCGYGSDLFWEDGMRKSATYGKGRYQIVFEPTNLDYAYKEQWTRQMEKYILNRIVVKKDAHQLSLLGGRLESNKLPVALATHSGFCSNAIFFSNQVVLPGDKIEIDLSLSGSDGKLYRENVSCIVSPMSDSARDKLIDRESITL